MGAALLLMLVTGLFLAGWVTVMSTRSIQVSWLEDALSRRIALENSRMLSWETVMEHAFEPDDDFAGQTALLTGGKEGGLSTNGGWKDLNLYVNLDTPETLKTDFPYNPSGLRPGPSFMNRQTFLKPPALEKVDSFFAHNFLKSHCPILNGDLITIYKKPANYAGELNVHNNAMSFNVYGRVVVRHPPSLFVQTTSKVTLPIQSKSLYIQSYDAAARYPIVGTTLDGKVLLPSNMPVVPSSTGPQSQASPSLFEGELNVVHNKDYPDNSLWNKMVEEAYDNIEVFTKSRSQTDPWYMVQYSGDAKPRVLPPSYPSGYDNLFRTLYINVANPSLKHLRISNNGSAMDQIVFVGQTTAAEYEAAGALSPVIILLENTGSKWAKNIAFEHDNNRRIILGVKDEYSLTSKKKEQPHQMDLSWAGSPILGQDTRWRMTFINEGHAVFVGLPDNTVRVINWIGGVMTNWSFWRDIKTAPRAERLIFRSDGSMPTLPIVGLSYATLLPRDVWLEAFFLPDPPPP
ncbi:hypothetical protein [Prosthecobacter debontii]|nr:hypothetical protein [Prosthecobacter debontii]